MAYRLADIAASLGIEAQGNLDLEVTGIAEPALAGPDQIALPMDPKYAASIAEGQARVALLWLGADWRALGLEAALTPQRPRFALSGASAMVDRGQGFGPGIHPSAVIDPSAEIAEGVAIGPFCVIGARARIGAGSVLGPHVTIGQDSHIGPNALLREGVRIGADVTIGARFIAQPNAVVGGDGFSFVTPEKSAVEQTRDSLGAEVQAEGQPWARIHSLAGVIVGDDVELGAGSCIDRGTVRPTQVGNGVKCDNLVQIGHNVVIGDHCLLCAQAGVAGSTRIGNFVVLGGQTGVSDNVFVGDRVIAGGGTKILSNVPAGRAVLGYPAVKMDAQVETYKALRRLPRLLADVDRLKKSVFNRDKSE